MDAATVANSKPVDGGVPNVVQNRHVDDPANPDTVGAEDGAPKLTAQELGKIGAHLPMLTQLAVMSTTSAVIRSPPDRQSATRPSGHGFRPRLVDPSTLA